MSRLQVAAQFLSAGTSSGVARCARLTVRALAQQAEVIALAVEDRASDDIAGVHTRAYAGSRSAFVAANARSGLSADWVIYDFAGTARAHTPLRLANKPYAVWVHGIEVWPGNLRSDYAKAIRRASAVFVNSRHTLERLSESLPGLTNAQLCLLGTEKDVDPLDRSWAQSSREPMALFVGRNDEMQVFQIREDKRAPIPAVTHVDGSGRLQTVHQAANPRYYGLIEAFEAATGVPMVLNTSFNENEPVVCRPEEALECFLRTKMDVLVLGDRIIERVAVGQEAPAPVSAEAMPS